VHATATPNRGSRRAAVAVVVAGLTAAAVISGAATATATTIGTQGVLTATVLTGAPVAMAQSSTSSPVGHLDQVIAIGRTLTVRGWELEPSAPLRVGTVHVYVDGAGTVLPPADAFRPDVAQPYPGTGSNHGFDDQVSFTASPGKHTVCAYGVSTSGGPSSLLGCQELTSPAQVNFSPIGAVDPLEFFPDGRAVVRGWALDPDDINTALQIHTYLDGRGVSIQQNGHAVENRPDVTAATGDGPRAFEVILPAQPAGRHTVCSYGINIGAGSNALLGCRTFG
jgi:hypothetical protein